MDILDMRVFDKFTDVINDSAGKTKWSALNAIEHLEMANRLASIDPIMSAFRAVCAEEEAATSLMLSLKSHRYPGAKALKPYRHEHKQGVIFLISALIKRFDELYEGMESIFERPVYGVTQASGRQAFGLGFPLKGTTHTVCPEPPLRIYSQAKGNPMTDGWYTPLLEKLHVISGTETIKELKKLIEVKANERNRMLYAAPNGIPRGYYGLDVFLRNQAGVVGALLTAFALIDPWRPPKYKLSPLVAQMLNIFNDVMSQIDRPAPDFSDHPAPPAPQAHTI